MDQSKPKTFKCPACSKDCTKLLSWSKDGRKVCFSCQQKESAAVKAQQAAAVKEAEATLASEVAARKAEALKPKAGRTELGRWVEKDEGIQLMTRITSLNAASVKPEPPRWLWYDHFPAGTIGWVVGKPGNAKSLFATDLAARVSSGANFADGAKNTDGPRKVLMYAGEDDIKRTVVPRLMAAGANLANIELLDNQSFEIYDKEYNRIDRREINLAADVKMIGELVKTHPDISLLIIDPITGVFGSKNTNHDADMRPIMNELKDMLELRNLTLIGIAHTNKRSDAAAIDQIQGCSSMSGAARAAWLFTRDPESDDEHAHLMSYIKVNQAEKHDGLKLLTVAAEVNAEVGKHPMIVWGEGMKMEADEVNQAIKEKRETKGGKRDAAKMAILAFLSEGAKLSTEVYTAVEKLGHSHETVKRAAGELTDEREICREQKSKRWYMVLPEHLYEFEQGQEPEQMMALSAGEAL